MKGYIWIRLNYTNVSSLDSRCTEVVQLDLHVTAENCSEKMAFLILGREHHLSCKHKEELYRFYVMLFVRLSLVESPRKGFQGRLLEAMASIG